MTAAVAVRFCIILLHLSALEPNIFVHSSTVKPFSLAHGDYFCYVRCLAKCSETKAHLELCNPDCQKYQNRSEPICSQNDAVCWNTCDGLTALRDITESLKRPVSVNVTYATNPEPSPRKAQLEWSTVESARLYVIEYAEADDKFQTWETGGLGRIETVYNKYIVQKKNLCPEYLFRVAAVNEYSVGEFSDVVKLKKPVPIQPYPNPTVDVRELINESFVDMTGNQLSNGTVRLRILYNPPPGWILNNVDVIPRFSYPHLITCKYGDSIENYAMPTAELDKTGEPFVYYSFPQFVYERECTFTSPIERFESKCGTSYNYEHNQTPFVFNFTCENVKYTKCYQPPKIIEPVCMIDNFTYDRTLMNNTDFMSVTMHWSKWKKVDGKILYWVVKYTQGEKDNSFLSPTLTYKPIKEIGTHRICEGPSSATNPNCNETAMQLTVDDVFHPGLLYVVYLCAVYNTTANEAVIKWEIINRVSMDFTDEVVRMPKTIQKSETSMLTLGLAIGLSVFFAVLVSAITAFILLSKKRCIRPKSINELALEEKSNQEDRYVAMPRRFDHWELPRKRLTLYEDQKLGSGAFGAVYKGKIGGKVMTHKDSMSVLAENWMKAENCDVAVKMLPEYADESAKSDFRKEINLMKQLGNHERLVNMLACITAEEPLCLIVEYCSEGDLLHYLRERRKYMIKLEEANVDIHNLSENHDVDFSLILCLKDLISFAWQISVGLEYLSQKGFIHRDVAARNILVDKGKKAKIGDFGLCRFSYSDPIYMGKGGRLPIKWMALEAIKNYEFTNKSDVWSFGVLLFEIITLGGSPYPGIQPSDMEQLLESGKRMDQPDNCPNELYELMLGTWHVEADKRPTFTQIRDQLRQMLEHLTEDYSYLSLNQKRDYYNVVYGEDGERREVKRNAFANFNFTPDHEIELNSDNAISDNVFRAANDKQETVPQKSISTTLPVSYLLHNAVHTDSISLSDDGTMSPPPSAAKWRDSVSSDKVLITPDSAEPVKPRFFKFFKSPLLEDVPEVTVSSTKTVDNGLVMGGVNNDSLDYPSDNQYSRQFEANAY